MATVVNIFSTDERSPKDFSVASANLLVPLVKRYTEEAIQETQKIALKLEYVAKDSPQFKALSAAHDQVILKWAERIHRIGGLAKGLWTVDFDNGSGYLCWSYPEDKIDHYHTYEGGFKTRKPFGEAAAKPSKPSNAANKVPEQPQPQA